MKHLCIIKIFTFGASDKIYIKIFYLFSRSRKTSIKSIISKILLRSRELDVELLKHNYTATVYEGSKRKGEEERGRDGELRA